VAKAETQKRAKKQVYFVSLGCPKNRVDSEVMLGVANEEGYAITEDPETAQVIVINTCGFIGEAKKESIDTVFELAEMKKVGACKKLVVTGCLSQRYAKDLETQMPEVDHFLGSSDMLKLREVLKSKSAPRMLVGNPADWVPRATDPRVLTGPRASAYVKIAEGCNRTCAFCTIPEFRGKQRSRAHADVIREVEELAAAGVREINLISQDTVSYGRDLPKDERLALASLIEAVANVKGVHWVRVFYLYPETLDDALVQVIAQHPKVVKYVDMPLQHAADAMLKRMKRGHGIDRQKRVVERLRKEIPGLTFRTAFIVGHPGETEAEFQELCDFVSWAKFERMGVFRYSDEESAKSYNLDAKVSAKDASSRYRKLMTLQRKIAKAANRALIGQDLEVLVEGPSAEHDLVMVGRHAGQAPDIDGSVYLSGNTPDGLPIEAGTILRAQITQASDYDLVADVLDAPVLRPLKRGRMRLQVLGQHAHI
jgi:ribosomal protein S12 methylthiotransferase